MKHPVFVFLSAIMLVLLTTSSSTSAFTSTESKQLDDLLQEIEQQNCTTNPTKVKLALSLLQAKMRDHIIEWGTLGHCVSSQNWCLNRSNARASTLIDLLNQIGKIETLYNDLTKSDENMNYKDRWSFPDIGFYNFLILAYMIEVVRSFFGQTTTTTKAKSKRTTRLIPASPSPLGKKEGENRENESEVDEDKEEEDEDEDENEVYADESEEEEWDRERPLLECSSDDSGLQFHWTPATAR